MALGYNEGLLLDTVSYTPSGQAVKPIVTGITYDAKRQRQSIWHGNGVKSTATYDPKTFRISRILATRGVGEILQDHNYTYDAKGNIVEWTDEAQQTHYFNNTEVSPTQQFEYDALDRIQKAMGRELIGLNSGPSESDITASLLPNDTTALRNYTQRYTLDHLGNMLQVQHTATGGNWNRYYHYADPATGGNNHLLSTSSDNVQPTTDQYTYDQHGSMLSMPHLASMGYDWEDQLREVDLPACRQVLAGVARPTTSTTEV